MSLPPTTYKVYTYKHYVGTLSELLEKVESDIREYTRPRKGEVFYQRCSEWYNKTKSFVERVFNALASWSPFTARLVVEVDPCEELKITFDPPSHIVVTRGGVYMYLHWLSGRELAKLLAVVDAARELGVKLHVEVDSRWDHCPIPEEKMRELGFRLEANWHLEL
jgi:hypothetical protein